MKKFLTISTILIFLLGGLFIFLVGFQPVRLIFENESNKELINTTITVSGKELDFGRFSPGDRKTKWFLHSGGDTDYYVQVETTEHEKFDERDGYLTSGMILYTMYIEFRNGDEIYFDEI